MRFQLGITVIQATAVAALAASTYISNSWAAALPKAAPALQATVTATTGTALDKREIRAQLAPRRYTTLAAEIGAKISRLPLPEGAAFKQGQPLIQFDCALQQTQFDKSKASLVAAQ
ncbi:MAG TPA: efflux transporter periplasmic adaptor subunit, partial [Noviherbaspirillum sp.]